jgi:hypothetical protein
MPLDLIAIVEAPLDTAQKDRLAALHQRLVDEESAAAELHCSYLAGTQSSPMPRPAMSPGPTARSWNAR